MDRIDRAIVVALQNDARLSNKELAGRVGLAPSSCLQRVRRLREQGVLRGFHASVDPAALGIGLQAMVALRLRDHASEAYRSLWEAVAALPEVVALYHLAGTTDLLVHVAVRDATHLRAVVVEHISAHPSVRNVETSLIFESEARDALPVYV